MDVLLTRDNVVLSGYAFYTGLLVLKMFFMVVLTTRARFSKKVFASPEDLTAPHIPRGSKIAHNDPDVERTRRAHRNDLENIPSYIFISFLYVLTQPNPWLALNLFRVFFVARVIHSISYAMLHIHFFRMIAYFTGLFITFYMTGQVLLHFWML